MAQPTMISKLVAEFVGTFLLVFAVGCAVLTGNADFAGLAIGTVLFIAITGLGAVSGANFNPAVSIGLGITKSMGANGMEWTDVVAYCVVQIVAGLAAAFGFTTMLPLPTFSPITVEPKPGFLGPPAFVCEALYTFMLVFVVLNVAAAKNKKNQYFGLAIGFCVVAGAYGAGAVSGGCFNPAVVIGLASTSETNVLMALSYIFFELVGAAVAAGAFRMVRPQDFSGCEPGTMPKLLSEFLGTFILVLTVGLNVLAKAHAGALSIAASLAAMIYALGDVSGAHFNPAVTCAILFCGRSKIAPADAAGYVVMQILGGLAAGFTYDSIYSWQDSGPFGPGKGYSLHQALAAEAVFTFVLAFTVLCVAVSKLTSSSEYFGLAIGFCVVVGGFGIGGISGGALNPAVAFGLASVGGGVSHATAYAVVELLAGAVAAGVFQITHLSEFGASPAEEELLEN